MNVLVVGCGRLGTRLAEMLEEYGHDVAVIDSNSDNFRLLNDNFNGITVKGMPMDMNVLQSAGVESCDAVAVVTPDDNLNITVSQIVREFFGVENVVARISDPAREKVFKSFGLRTICPTKIACGAMVTALTQQKEAKHITFDTSTVAFDCRPIDNSLIGSNVSMVPIEDNESILGVLHKDGSMELYNNNKKIVLSADDQLVFANISD